MKILFMGTPEPAAACLKALIEAKHDITAVFTQPDKPKGRGLAVSGSAVKILAKESNIPVHQPENIKDSSAIDLVKKIAPELIVVVAYGKILPREIIEAPKLGSINVHASLLPKYRGAAPIQWAIMNGEKETGITIQKVAVELDSGDIILQEKLNIDKDDNTTTMTKKLFNIGAPLLIKAIKLIEAGKAEHIKQDSKKISMAPSLKKEAGRIDWKKDAEHIYNQIRACIPWPVTFTYYKGKMLKIWQAEVTGEGVSGEPGKIYEISKERGIEVGAGRGTLLIHEVQQEGGKRMSAHQFAIGHNLQEEEILPN